MIKESLNGLPFRIYFKYLIFELILVIIQIICEVFVTFFFSLDTHLQNLFLYLVIFYSDYITEIWQFEKNGIWVTMDLMTLYI